MRPNDLELFSHLEAVKKQEPALAGWVDLQRELIEASTRLETDIPPANLDAAQVRLSLQHGIPLLHTLPPALDWEQLAAHFQQVCQISARQQPELTEALTALEQLAQTQPEALRAAVIATLRLPQAEADGNMGAEQELLAFILLHSLRPFLQARARQLAPYLQDELWQQGYCPVCAGWPDLAYLEDSTRSRRLVCSRCDTDWRFPRVRCPFCNAAESGDLAYYPGPDEKYRLYVCNHCRRYLKALDAAHAGANVLYPIERVRTLSMDLAAQEAGYC